MTLPLVVLATMACLAGFAWQHRFLEPEQLYGFGLVPGKWEGAELARRLPETGMKAYEAFTEHHEHWHHLMMFIAIPAGLVGLGLGAFLYTTAKGDEIRAKLRVPLAPLFKVWKNKYYVDEIYWATFVAGAVGLSRFLAWWDREVVDGLVNLVGRTGIRLGDAAGWTDREVVDAQFVHGAAGLAWGAGGLFSSMQGGRVRIYVFQAVAATAVLALVVAAMYG